MDLLQILKIRMNTDDDYDQTKEQPIMQCKGFQEIELLSQKNSKSFDSIIQGHIALFSGVINNSMHLDILLTDGSKTFVGR